QWARTSCRGALGINPRHFCFYAQSFVSIVVVYGIPLFIIVQVLGLICNDQHALMALELIVYAHSPGSMGGGLSESERCRDPIPSSLRKAYSPVVSYRKTRHFSPPAYIVRLHCTSVQIAVPAHTNRYY